MAHPGDVIEIPATGERFVFRKRARDTDGEFLQLDFFVKPNGFAPLAHIHTRVEEKVEVVSGTARCRVGGKEQTIGPGETIVFPAGVAHTFWNEGPEELHFLAEVRPALNMEGVFESIFGLYRDGKINRRAIPRSIPSLLQNAIVVRESSTFAAGPPILLQRPIIALGAAMARLFGYRFRYPQYSGEE